jgi:hypothetical protein
LAKNAPAGRDHSSTVAASPAAHTAMVAILAPVSSWVARPTASAATPRALWSTALGGKLGSSPAISGGLVYAGSAVSDNNGSLCVVAAGGKVVKEYQTGGQVQSSPLAAAGWVVVGSENDEVLGVRLPAS